MIVAHDFLTHRTVGEDEPYETIYVNILLYMVPAMQM